MDLADGPNWNGSLGSLLYNPILYLWSHEEMLFERGVPFMTGTVSELIEYSTVIDSSTLLLLFPAFIDLEGKIQ